MPTKFKLPADPATSPKNIRFPNYLIKGIEDVTKGTNISFSQFVIEATKAALEDLEVTIK